MVKPEIAETLSREGLEIKYNKVICPFHEDRSPSLHIFTKTNSWYCFSCGIGGDSIDFIQRYKGMTFPEAVKYLSLDYRPQAKSTREATKRRLIEQFRAWEQRYYSDLCVLFRTIQRHRTNVTSVYDIDASAYHNEPILEHKMDILTYGNDEEKFGLCKEVSHEQHV